MHISYKSVTEILWVLGDQSQHIFHFEDLIYKVALRKKLF